MVFSLYRTFSIAEIPTLEDLLMSLRFRLVPFCKAYHHRGLYFFNDSSPDSDFQEFAVCIKKDKEYFQVDSLSVSIMKKGQMKEVLLFLLDGNYPFRVPANPIIDADQPHSCPLCKR